MDRCRSAAERVISPCTDMDCASNPRSVFWLGFQAGTRPSPGLTVTAPFAAAGNLRLPPMSLPWPIRPIPAAVAAADPPRQEQGDPRLDWMLQCRGCHLADASGDEAAGVPRIAGFAGKFIGVDGGDFNVRGVAPRAELRRVTAGLVRADGVMIDLWIDPYTSLVQRIEFSVEDRHGVSDWTIELSDYGTPFVIEPPADAEDDS